MAKDNRYRIWAFVVYPESASPQWREALGEIHAPFWVSPLHDQDKNPTGEPKKPHWHVIMQFTGKQTYERVNAISESIHATRPEPVKEVKGYLRYFAHLDNPEKAQYSVNDIEAHCGADMSYLTAPTASERHKYINEMREYCKEADVTEFSDLLDYAAEHHPNDWFSLLCDNSAYVMKAYVSSLRHKPRVRSDTGEIIVPPEDR